MSERVKRILTMVAYVRRQPEGVPLQELADYLGCTPKEAAEDIDAVLMCGVPPYLPSDYINAGIEGGRVFISFADHIHRPINLTLQEALALLLVLRSLPVGAGAHEAVGRLRGKILRLLPGRGGELRRIGRRIRLGGRRSALGRTLYVLEQAIARSRRVRMEYYTASRDAMTERELEPYALVEHGGNWYVVGRCLLRDRELPFRVDRIRRLKATRRTFAPRHDFDIERYRSSEMYFPDRGGVRVRIRVAPELVRWVREERPPSDIEHADDGSAVMSLSVTHPEWLLSWLIQHGTLMEVLAPDDLRRRMADFCDATLAVYRGAPAGGAASS